jgi:hypothetical protein
MGDSANEAALSVSLRWPGDESGPQTARHRGRRAKEMLLPPPRGGDVGPLLGSAVAVPSGRPTAPAEGGERVPADALSEVANRLDALSHASVGLHSVVVDRLARQGEDVVSVVKDALKRTTSQGERLSRRLMKALEEDRLALAESVAALSEQLAALRAQVSAVAADLALLVPEKVLPPTDEHAPVRLDEINGADPAQAHPEISSDVLPD